MELPCFESCCLLKWGESAGFHTLESPGKFVFSKASIRDLNHVLNTWFLCIIQLTLSSAHCWLYSRILCWILCYFQVLIILSGLNPFFPPITMAKKISSFHWLCLNHMPTLKLGTGVTALPKLHKLKVGGLFLQSQILWLKQR